MEFLHNSLQLIEHYMLIYGYWAVFFGVMLENAGVPVPGETILLVAGYFASTGEFHLWLVMLIAATGAVVGDNIGFAIGHHYGRSVLLRIGRFIFGLRVVGALLAGASNMKWRVFVVYNVAGAVLWSTVITTLGYLFGASLPLLAKWVGRSGTILLTAAIVIGLIAWRVQRHRRSK